MIFITSCTELWIDLIRISDVSWWDVALLIMHVVSVGGRCGVRLLCLGY